MEIFGEMPYCSSQRREKRGKNKLAEHAEKCRPSIAQRGLIPRGAILPADNTNPCLPKRGYPSPVSHTDHSLLQISRPSLSFLSEAIFILSWKSCLAVLQKSYYVSNITFQTFLGCVWHHQC